MAALLYARQLEHLQLQRLHTDLYSALKCIGSALLGSCKQPRPALSGSLMQRRQLQRSHTAYAAH